MRVIAVHRVDQPERLKGMDPNWAIWETDTDIGRTYKELAMTAVDEKWGHEMVVVQDDVRFVESEGKLVFSAGVFNRVPHWGADVVVHGGARYDAYGKVEHVCPHAFSASPNGWKRLEAVWLPAPNSLCYGFGKVVETQAVIMDLAAEQVFV